MYIYWNLFIHYGHVSTSVLLMVIHTCVIFFLTQAPLGVGPGVPCRHLVGSGKKHVLHRLEGKFSTKQLWALDGLSRICQIRWQVIHDSWSNKISQMKNEKTLRATMRQCPVLKFWLKTLTRIIAEGVVPQPRPPAAASEPSQTVTMRSSACIQILIIDIQFHS